MYATTIAEALEDTTIVMLSVGSVPAQVLFNFGCTHSFILYAYTNMIGSQIESLGHSLLVSTPTGRVIDTGKCVRNVTIEIQH